MKSAAVAAAALVVFLAGGRSAHAAATVQIDVFPSQPRVGELVTVQLRPYWPRAVDNMPPALIPADFAWRLAALSPSGRPVAIPLARRPDDPYVWSGVARLRRRGTWTICVLRFVSTPRSCGANVPGWQRLRVRARRAHVDVWHGLERPFHIPTVADGGPCPTTPRDSKGDLTRIGFTGPAWGEGPAYPGGLDVGGEQPVLRYEDPILPGSLFFGSAWSGNKVLWMMDPAYRGPLLIRGRQVDGPNELRFDDGMLPPRAIEVFAGARSRPSFTRVRRRGCYAYQVDGVGFSNVIVFEARPF